MFGRAELQRRVVLVVALLVTAGSTGAFAREFRGADTRSEDYPTVEALRSIHASAQRDPASAKLIERIRRVE